MLKCPPSQMGQPEERGHQETEICSGNYGPQGRNKVHRARASLTGKAGPSPFVLPSLGGRGHVSDRMVSGCG